MLDTLCCGEVEPHVRLHIILWDSLALVVHDPQDILGLCGSLFGQRLEFSKRSDVVPALIGRHPCVKISDGRSNEPGEEDQDQHKAFHSTSLSAGCTCTLYSTAQYWQGSAT